VAWWWALGWAWVIEVLMLWPHPPNVPEPFRFIGLDKLVHATLFGVQAALTVRAMRGSGRPSWMALVAVVVFAAGTEIGQHFVPSRSAELADFLADSAGAGIGAGVFAVWARRRQELFR